MIPTLHWRRRQALRTSAASRCCGISQARRLVTVTLSTGCARAFRLNHSGELPLGRLARTATLVDGDGSGLRSTRSPVSSLRAAGTVWQLTAKELKATGFPLPIEEVSARSGTASRDEPEDDDPPVCGVVPVHPAAEPSGVRLKRVRDDAPADVMDGYRFVHRGEGEWLRRRRAGWSGTTMGRRRARRSPTAGEGG